MLQRHINHRQGSTGRPEITTVRRLHTVTLLVLLGLLVLGVLAEVAHAIEVPLPTKEQMVYGDFPVVGRRIAIWAIAQLHLMFGAFVVGVPLFILIIEIMGAATKQQRYDDLAHEFTRLLSVAFSTTATFGGILVFFLIGLYPTFTNFLARIFFPSMVVYVFLFFGESFSMYLYYYGWGALKGTSRRVGTILGTAVLTLLVLYPAVLLLSYIGFGESALPVSYGLTVVVFIALLTYGWLSKTATFLHNQKWMHICFGILLNYCGLLLMMIANSWATFMTSPVGIDVNAGVFRGTAWEAMNNFTWMPVNLHRFIANIAFGGSVVAAYAAFRFLASPRDSAARAHYDWMAYIGNFIAIIGLIPLPFAGYWLGREIYGYDQQLGITMMGGIFSWLFIVQAVLIGALFLGANYYLWLGMERIPGSERYRRFIPILLGILTVCFLVWLTPHSLVASLEEARKMGGTHHPLLGVFGVMSAKMTVANLMILVTFMSFIMYWRAGKRETATWAKVARAFMGGVLGVAAIVVIVLGVWGYFVPAIVRINYFSVAQVLIVLFVMLTITPLTAVLLKSAQTTTEMVWGRMPPRAGYALVLNAVMVILLMTLMGYARSSSRVHWHIYGVMRDSSQYAFSPALGYAAAFMALNTFLFCLLVAFIFWVATMGDKGKAPTASVKGALPHGAMPAMAGGSQGLDKP